MPKIVDIGGIGQVQFSDGVSDEEIAQAAEQLYQDKQDLASQGYVHATGNAFAQAAVAGVGSGLKGLAAVAETAPVYPSVYGLPSAAFLPANVEALNQQKLARLGKPAELMQAIRGNPAFQLGQAITEAAPETYPVVPARAGQVGPTVGRFAGGFLPLVASGPAAPVTIGLQSLGEHLDTDYQQGLATGLSEEDAAGRALGRGITSGTLQAGIFAALPAPLRKAGEKYLVEKFGSTAAKRFVAGRASLAAEGGVLGAASTAAENVASDRPVMQDVAAGAAGLGALNVLMPPYGIRARPLQGAGDRVQVETPVRESPPNLQPAPSTLQPVEEILPKGGDNRGKQQQSQGESDASASANAQANADARRAATDAVEQGQGPERGQIAPVPESPATLAAQLDLVQAGTKPAMLVTPGEQVPTLPTGMAILLSPEHGTFIYDPKRIDRETVSEMVKAGQVGTLLGYGSDSKPENGKQKAEIGNQAVLQTKTPEGVVAQDEVVTPQTLPAAVAAAQQTVPGGTMELKTPEAVVAERQQAAGGKVGTGKSVQKFSGTLFQGRGSTPEEIYGPEAVKAGRAAPILGPGDYFAHTKEDAAIYGKVSQKKVSLANAFTIDSDKAWRDLLKASGTTVLDSRGREWYEHPEGIAPATVKLQEYLKGQGYDGVIVKVPMGDMNSAGESIKGLVESFGHSQVVKFPGTIGPGKAYGMGGSTRPAPRAADFTKSTPPEVTAAPAPKTGPIRQWLEDRGETLRGISASAKRVFNPTALDAGARTVANILRHNLGTAALGMDRAEAAMHAVRNEFDRTPVPRNWTYDPAQPLPHNFAVIDAFERNRAALPERYQDLAKMFDQAFAERIAVIQQYAPNALQHLIENYFPHIWTDPKRATEVMAQVATRLFAGRKEFLKQRSLPIFQAGLERGLKPISDNPVDLVLAKLHSMDRFIIALKSQSEFREIGAMKFQYFFGKTPDGWVKFDDPAFIVQHPPVVTVKEAYDEFQRAGLLDLLKSMGVNYQRLAALTGGKLGLAWPGLKLIEARIGASEDVLWHEAGHHIDYQFPDLRSFFDLRGRGTAANELRALVDLNHPGVPHDSDLAHHKYLRKSEEKMAEVVRAYVHAPDLFQRTAPTVWKAFNGFLDTHPDLRSKLDAIKPAMKFHEESTDIKLGGMQVLGHWIMPEGPATIIKNYLSPGLSQSSIYRSIRQTSNVLNGAQLGLSAFHLGFTSLDAATSRLALSLEDLAHGDVSKAARTLVSVPLSPVTNILTGARLKAEALRPGTHPDLAPIVHALELGGGRVGNDRMWQTEFTRRMVRAWHEGGLQWATLPIRVPLAAWEQTMRPILEYVVPRQKLGVFADMARRELDRLGPDAEAPALREAMRKAWDSVDNRMGQVVYSNLFYNRMVKDVALLSWRAYGWQLGKYREGLGALLDAGVAAKQVAKLQRPELTHRMAYAAALPIMVGTIGGVLHYLMTGQAPQQAVDYFMPATGETDRNGNLERLNLPSYVKDVIAYSKHPLTSFGHSLNPLGSSMFDLLENLDFYDVQIRNPDDPLFQQGSDVVKFATKQFIPFSVSGTQQLREDDAPLRKQVLPFFGITPAPARLTMTPAQALASDIIGDSMPKGPRTREQFDKSTIIKEIVADMKARKPDAVNQMTDAIRSGKLQPAAIDTILNRVRYSPLQFQVLNMEAEPAMRVWRVANDQERQALRPLIAPKILNSKTVPVAQKQAHLQELGVSVAPTPPPVNGNGVTPQPVAR